MRHKFSWSRTNESVSPQTTGDQHGKARLGYRQRRAVTRDDLVALLNDDLAREYQAIISYVVYSQTLKGAQYMNIAAELEKHAAEELAHALIIAGQIDYLGGMPLAVPKPVKTSADAQDMLRFDLDNENETIHLGPVSEMESISVNMRAARRVDA